MLLSYLSLGVVLKVIPSEYKLKSPPQIEYAYYARRGILLMGLWRDKEIKRERDRSELYQIIAIYVEIFNRIIPVLVQETQLQLTQL